MLTKKQLQLRRDVIGASEISVLAKLSRWATPIEIYEAKVAGADPLEEPTVAMDIGNELEEPVAKIYARRTGKWVKSVDSIKNQRYPYLLATPDRAVFTARVAELARRQKLQLPDLSEAESLLECKTTGWRTAKYWGTPGTDEIPDEYMCQVQVAMGVTGKRFTYVPVLFVDRRVVEVYAVRFHEEFFMGLSELAARFMIDHVAARRPPDPDATDRYAEAVARLYPNPYNDKERKDLTLIQPAEFVLEKVMRYAKLKRAEKLLKDHTKKLGNDLRLLIGSKDGIVHERFGLITYRTTKDRIEIDWELVANEALRLAGLVLNADNQVDPEARAQLTKEIGGLVAKYTKTQPGHRPLMPYWSGEAKAAQDQITLTLDKLSADVATDHEPDEEEVEEEAEEIEMP